jgi:hypothetical protein
MLQSSLLSNRGYYPDACICNISEINIRIFFVFYFTVPTNEIEKKNQLHSRCVLCLINMPVTFRKKLNVALFAVQTIHFLLYFSGAAGKTPAAAYLRCHRVR